MLRTNSPTARLPSDPMALIRMGARASRPEWLSDVATRLRVTYRDRPDPWASILEEPACQAALLGERAWHYAFHPYLPWDRRRETDLESASRWRLSTRPEPRLAFALGADPFGVAAAADFGLEAARRLRRWGAPACSSVLWHGNENSTSQGSEADIAYSRPFYGLQSDLSRTKDASNYLDRTPIGERAHALSFQIVGDPEVGRRSSAMHHLIQLALVWQDGAEAQLPLRLPGSGEGPMRWAHRDGERMDLLDNPFTPVLSVLALGYRFEGFLDHHVVLGVNARGY